MYAIDGQEQNANNAMCNPQFYYFKAQGLAHVPK